MNCEQTRGDLIAYLKGELTGRRKEQIEAHLAQCPACRKELDEAKRVLEWTEAASTPAVIKKIDDILADAIRSAATDIHWEPQQDGTLVVRRRIDGVLGDVDRIDSTERHGVIAKLKMMADMDVSVSRRPQDGRISVHIDNRDYDLRVSVFPFYFGEGIVCRILDRSGVLLGLDKLGLDENNLRKLEEIVRNPMGMVIVSGVTGAGMTTTCYSILQRVASPSNKTVTIEDPVEYLIPGINHAGVNASTGFTFASAIRSYLRHDPDVIMVGEIRDTETAVLSAQAALTGHLVVTVVQAEDAIKAIQRLRDIGTGDYGLAASLAGITNQRLIRRVCQNCKKPVEVSPNEPAIRGLGITPEELKEHQIYRGDGCDTCLHTGHKGRIAIFEVLPISRKLSEMIGSGASLDEIREEAVGEGFQPMREDAKRKVLEGITSPEEAFRMVAHFS